MPIKVKGEGILLWQFSAHGSDPTQAEENTSATPLLMQPVPQSEVEKRPIVSECQHSHSALHHLPIYLNSLLFEKGSNLGLRSDPVPRLTDLERFDPRSGKAGDH